MSSLPSPTSTFVPSDRPDLEKAVTVLVKVNRWPWKVIAQMAIFYLAALTVMMGNYAWCDWLHNKTEEHAHLTQDYQSAIANCLAVVVEILLLGAISVAYNQIVWMLFRRKSFTVGTIDRLTMLVTAPWNLWRPAIVLHAFPAAVVSLLCVFTPVAVIFPPGGVTVEFREGVVRTPIPALPTMNISDIGNGSTGSFVDKSLLRIFNHHDLMTLAKQQGINDTDASSANIQEFLGGFEFEPRLKSIAAQVLGTGKPVEFSSPPECAGPCDYHFSMDGPRFHCKKRDPEDGLIHSEECADPLHGAIYVAEDQTRTKNLTVVNNSFMISWFPKPLDKGCRRQDMRTLDCSISLATYNVSITYNENKTREVDVGITGERDIWPESSPGVLTSVMGYVSTNEPKTESYDEIMWKDDEENLRKNFTLSQAYVISRAAIAVLSGNVRLLSNNATEKLFFGNPFHGNATDVIGSPYIGLTDRRDPTIYLTGDSLQDFLQDVVVSTIALNNENNPTWVNQNKVVAYRGSNVYIFDNKGRKMVYAPYTACLGATALIYLFALWSLHRNGVSAGHSFLQFVTTTSRSKTLHNLAELASLGGVENVPRDLRDLKLRYGMHKASRHSGTGEVGQAKYSPVIGFGTEDELQRLVQR